MQGFHHLRDSLLYVHIDKYHKCFTYINRFVLLECMFCIGLIDELLPFFQKETNTSK